MTPTSYPSLACRSSPLRPHESSGSVPPGEVCDTGRLRRAQRTSRGAKGPRGCSGIRPAAAGRRPGIKEGLYCMSSYEEKIQEQIAQYVNVDIHALPEIYHYWSNRYLLPRLKQVCGVASVAGFYGE